MVTRESTLITTRAFLPFWPPLKHRVITTEARFSAGNFHGSSLDATLDPLPLAQRFAVAVTASPRHRQAGYMAGRAETEAGVDAMTAPRLCDTYGSQVWSYLSRSYPENMARHYSV